MARLLTALCGAKRLVYDLIDGVGFYQQAHPVVSSESVQEGADGLLQRLARGPGPYGVEQKIFVPDWPPLSGFNTRRNIAGDVRDTFNRAGKPAFDQGLLIEPGGTLDALL